MSSVIFEIYGFEIKWYSVLILFSVVLAYFLISNECRRFQIKKEFVFNLAFWTIIFGIIGARLYYVLFNLDYYKNNLSEIYKIWHGGIAIHGALLFGLLTVIFYCKKYKVNVKKMLDIIAPAVIIAQAIGRWGNFFNMEAYGSIVSYATLVKLRIIPQFVIDNMYINGNYHLPMFYFESLLCLVGFIIMLIVRRFKYTKNGEIFSIYLMWYGFIRFFIEIYRTDSLLISSVKVAQIVSVSMFIFGFVLLIIQKRKPKLDDLYNKREEEIKF